MHPWSVQRFTLRNHPKTLAYINFETTLQLSPNFGTHQNHPKTLAYINFETTLQLSPNFGTHHCNLWDHPVACSPWTLYSTYPNSAQNFSYPPAFSLDSHPLTPVSTLSHSSCVIFLHTWQFKTCPLPRAYLFWMKHPSTQLHPLPWASSRVMLHIFMVRVIDPSVSSVRLFPHLNQNSSRLAPLANVANIEK